jgi:hypothetical protein
MPDQSLAFDADLCSFVTASYDLTPTLVAGDVRVVLTEKNGITFAAFPGTRPDHWEDWFTDFSAWPSHLVDHPEVGRCHDGVITGAEAIFQQFFDAMVRAPRFMMGGHSLGGGFALGVGALGKSRGIVPARLTTFGALRVGMAPFAALLAPIEGRRYRNGDDPVPEAPCWPFLNDRAWTRIGKPAWNPIDDHAIAGYQAALSAALVPA